MEFENNIEAISKLRQEFFLKEKDMRYPGMKFSEDELKANKIFEKIRQESLKEEIPKDLYQKAYKYFHDFPKYSLFPIIQSIPKTSLFHVHSDVCCKPDWLIKTFDLHKEHIYTRKTKKHFYFFNNDPPSDDYILVRKLRDESEDPEKFDQKIKNQIAVSSEEIDALDHEGLWGKFVFGLISIFGVILHKDIYEEYITGLFNDVVDDGLQHICIRLIAGSIKDDKRQGIPDEDVVKIIESCKASILKREPMFTYSLVYMGVKSIKETQEQNLVCAFKISKLFPKISVGYDLVDNEDNSDGQWDMRDMLVTRYNELKKEYGSNVHYVFHAGESHNYKNTNVLDSVLLGAKRIGHGLTMFMQPYLIDELKKRDIVFEASILSNLVMKYEYDLRRHPSIMLHNSGIKITLNSDDPGAFRISPVSHDTFAAVYAFPLNLKDIKRIQLNGIDGMILNEKEKIKHRHYFLGRWTQFIEKFLKDFS